jgi:hypothetical protein
MSSHLAYETMPLNLWLLVVYYIPGQVLGTKLNPPRQVF